MFGVLGYLLIGVICAVYWALEGSNTEGEWSVTIVIFWPFFPLYKIVDFLFGLLKLDMPFVFKIPLVILLIISFILAMAFYFWGIMFQIFQMAVIEKFKKSFSSEKSKI